MRKNAKYLLLTLLIFCFAVKVDAAECSYEKQVELNNLAATVKATYEEVEIDTGETYSYVDDDGIIYPDNQIPVKGKGFNVKLLNLTNDMSATITSDDGRINKTYFYSNSKDGTVDLGNVLANKVVTYTIKIYSNVEGCNLDLRTIMLVTPMYNSYSEMGFCSDYPNFEYCQEYTTDTTYNLKDFREKAEEYRKTNKKEENKEKTNKTENKFLNFIKNNKKLLIVIGSIILIAGVTTIVIIIIKKRSRLI